MFSFLRNGAKLPGDRCLTFAAVQRVRVAQAAISLAGNFGRRGCRCMRGTERRAAGPVASAPHPPGCASRRPCVQRVTGHDLAPLRRDMRPAPGRWPKDKAWSKGLIWPAFCGQTGRETLLDGCCGTLTYRQTLQAKRQPCSRIAAAQQTKVRNGARRCGGKRNEPIGGPFGIATGERRAAALLQDVLGFDAAIGLIRFVRSASSRG